MTSFQDAISGGEERMLTKGDPVASFAEDIAFFMFSRDFLRRYPTGFVFAQDKYKDPSWKRRWGRVSPILDVAIAAIDEDFRNVYSKGKGNKALVSKKALPEDLRKGGRRKADGLGVALNDQLGEVICELLEVTTREQASSTIVDDLQDKLNILNGPVKEFANHKIDALNMSTPYKGFRAYGTPFIPPLLMRQWPLPSTIAAQGLASSQIEWVSFWPTCDVRPCDFVLNNLQVAIDGETSPTRGLVLYKVYRANPPVVAVPITAEMRRILKWMGYKRFLGPELLPELSTFWETHKRERDTWIKSIDGGALIVLTICVVAALAVLWLASPPAGALATGAAGLLLLSQSDAFQMVSDYEEVVRVVYSIHSSAFASAGLQMPV